MEVSLYFVIFAFDDGKRTSFELVPLCEDNEGLINLIMTLSLRVNFRLTLVVVTAAMIHRLALGNNPTHVRCVYLCDRERKRRKTSSFLYLTGWRRREASHWQTWTLPEFSSKSWSSFAFIFNRLSMPLCDASSKVSWWSSLLKRSSWWVTFIRWIFWATCEWQSSFCRFTNSFGYSLV